MDVLHAKGSAAVAEIRATLSDPPSYSAVRALLGILETKGHLRHRQEGARYVYMPSISPEAASRSALKRLVATFFQGSPTRAMAALLEDQDTKHTKTELDQIQKLIKQAKTEGR